MRHIKLTKNYSVSRWNKTNTVSLQQITGVTVGEVRAVSDMHQRKAEMARQADAFIALPGTDKE